MDPPRPRPDVLFIVNPAANGGRAASRWQREVEPLIDERLRVIDPTDGSSTVRVLYTRGPGDAETFSRDAVESGSARVVVAAGGDGTISEVFNGFFAGLGRAPAVPDPDGQQPPAALAVLPCGTGSDLIRSFGWDRSPASGIRRIAGGQRAKVDLLRLTWRGGRFHRDVVRHCANVASAGISSAVAGLAPRYKWLGPTLCYALGTVHAFLTRHTDLSLEVCVDGGEWQRLDRATCVVLGNGAYFGGGMKIAPDAKVDSGSVQVVTLQAFSLLDFALHGSRLYNGTHTDLPGVSVTTAHSCVRLCVAADQTDRATLKPYSVEIDGEVLGILPVGRDNALSVEVVKEAVDVLV